MGQFPNQEEFIKAYETWSKARKEFTASSSIQDLAHKMIHPVDIITPGKKLYRLIKHLSSEELEAFLNMQNDTHMQLHVNHFYKGAKSLDEQGYRTYSD